MAAGSLIAGESTVPWIAWPETGANGKWQILVSRLDTDTRNSFLPVGASLNVDPNHDAQGPIITVPGSFQSELGCPADWDPSCMRPWLTDQDGDGTFT